jgi:starch-binding outer membrane protein, SusD/RagB family
LLDDLAIAADLVPWRNQANGTNERITKGAVKGLRARIALTAGGYSLRRTGGMQRPANYLEYYQIARNETLEIIQSGQHALNPNFEAVFKNALCAHAQEPNGEIVWEIGMTGGSSATGDSKLGYYNGPRVNNLGNSALTVLPTTFYDYHPADLRRDVSIAPYNVNANGTLAPRRLRELVDGKFRRDWITNPSYIGSNAQYFGVNWPVMRYSDVLLMFAEAENELNNGPTGAAISAFEQVRIRGFGGDASLIGATPLDKQGFFEAIMMERKLEFMGEGIRKFDLIRWNLLGQKLEEERVRLNKLANREEPYHNLPTVMYYIANQTTMQWVTSFYEPQPAIAPPGATSINWVNLGEINNNITSLLGVGFQSGKSELLPIPTTVLDANPNLTQDYGY